MNLKHTNRLFDKHNKYEINRKTKKYLKLFLLLIRKQYMEIINIHF